MTCLTVEKRAACLLEQTSSPNRNLNEDKEYGCMKNTKRFYAIIRIEKMCCLGTGATPEDAFQKAGERLSLKVGATISNTPFFPLTRHGKGKEGLCIARCTSRFVKGVARENSAYLKFTTDAEGRLDVQDQDRNGKATRTGSGGQ
jgi:hypothetical protein